jgi:hypothetical protein
MGRAVGAIERLCIGSCSKKTASEDAVNPLKEILEFDLLRADLSFDDQ